MTGFLERIAAGDADAVRAALADAPELAALRTADGVSAVLHAMYVNQREIASDIASAKGTLDAFEAAALGRSVELRAALAGQPAAATALTDDGFTALHYAAFFGDGACAQALLEAGADPHAVARNSMRVQPLHSAAAARNLAVAELLLASGADPDAEQEGGFRPLDAAVQNGDAELQTLLRAHGAHTSPFLAPSD